MAGLSDCGLCALVGRFADLLSFARQRSICDSRADAVSFCTDCRAHYNNHVAALSPALNQAQTRLQMIEAAASRGASWSETSYMLQRLDEGQRNVPLGLESMREQQRLLEDAERELRSDSTSPSKQ